MSASTIIATPATADDFVTNSDIYLATLALVEAAGITDPAILAPFTADSDEALALAAANVIASQPTGTDLTGDEFSHVTPAGLTANYTVDVTVTPPKLVLSKVAALSTIPVTVTTLPTPAAS
jgi:hypothetical protein